MKFKTIADCPVGVNALTPDAQAKWMEIANNLIQSGDSEAFACDRAWTSIKEDWTQNADGSWMKKVPAGGYPMFNMDDPTHQAKGVEIFDVGEWKGDPYTDKDLDAMVKHFNDGVIKNVPLKIGHDPKQQVAGQPAVGFVERLYRVGSKLLADFKNIPKLVAQAINDKAYHAVSSEIALNADFGGTVFEKLLTGVALLGAEIPAVNTLADLPAVFKAGKLQVCTFALTDGRIAPKAEAKTEDDEKAQMQATIARLKADNEAKDRKVAEMQADKEKADKKAADDAADEKAKAERKEIADFSAKLVSEQKIVPALRERIERSLEAADNSVKAEFSVGTEKVVESARENLMRIYDGLGKLRAFEEFGRQGDAAGGGTNAEKLIALTKKYEAENKLSYAEAYRKAGAEHPEWVAPVRDIKAK